MARRPKRKLLRALRPNAGFGALYRRRLTALVEEMARSVEYWLKAAYRKNEPAVATLAADAEPPQIAATYAGGSRPWTATIDGDPLRTSGGAVIKFATAKNAVLAARRFAGELLPADELGVAMKELGDYWQYRFDVASERLADYFATGAAKRTDAQLKAILRDGGWTVNFKMTPAVKDIVSASVRENVALIKSIPQQYLKNVEGLVMRSVQRGRDLSTLTDALEKQYGITRRRAAFIARDQNNKATAVVHDARQKQLGITQAIWLHSHGGRKPRPTHVANDGELYDVGKGWFDPAVGEYILPGELPNCRCTSRSVVPGFE